MNRKWPISDDFAQVKEPRHSEAISDEKLYLYHSMRSPTPYRTHAIYSILNTLAGVGSTNNKPQTKNKRHQPLTTMLS